MSKQITKEEILKKLEHFNDPTFIFNPGPHTYTLGGKPLTSATGYLHNFVKPFDSDYWSKKKADQEGITQEEMLARWDAKRDRSCDVGTMTHDYIENFYEKYNLTRNDESAPNDEEVKHRINKFHKIYDERLVPLQSIASELRIFSRIWPICGTLDKLYLYENQILVGDWKTNEKIKTDKDFCFGYLLPPFNKYKDNELNKYSLQISLYQLILEEAGIYSDYGFIVHLPTGEAEPKIIKVKSFKEELRGYLNKQSHLILTEDDKAELRSIKSEKLW